MEKSPQPELTGLVRALERINDASRREYLSDRDLLEMGTIGDRLLRQIADTPSQDMADVMTKLVAWRGCRADLWSRDVLVDSAIQDLSRMVFQPPPGIRVRPLTLGEPL
jgi:hypothetical protein